MTQNYPTELINRAHSELKFYPFAIPNQNLELFMVL